MCSTYRICGKRHKPKWQVSKIRRNSRGQFAETPRTLTKIFLIAFGVYAVSMIGVNTIWGWAKSLEKNFVVENSQAEVVWHQPTWQEEVLIMVKNAGLDAELANKIIQHESWWREDNTHKNKDGSTDYGLWMINNKYHPEVSISCSLDWFCSTKEAIRIWKERGPSEWVAYQYVK